MCATYYAIYPVKGVFVFSVKNKLLNSNHCFQECIFKSLFRISRPLFMLITCNSFVKEKSSCTGGNSSWSVGRAVASGCVRETPKNQVPSSTSPPVFLFLNVFCPCGHWTVVSSPLGCTVFAFHRKQFIGPSFCVLSFLANHCVGSNYCLWSDDVHSVVFTISSRCFTKFNLICMLSIDIHEVFLVISTHF